MPVVLNETVVRSLQVPTQRQAIYWFRGAMVEGRAVPAGFGVSVTPKGVKSFLLDYRIGPLQRRYTIGKHGPWSVLAAVREARQLRVRVDKGEDPLAARKEARKPPEPPEPERLVRDVIDDFIRVYVGKRLRQPRNYSQPLERLVVPAIGFLPIDGLRRSHIATMLNVIEDQNGPVMADRVLTYFGSCLNW